ncbi:hypothetical protein HN51_039988 [Arachis hypogaea]
MKQTVTKGEALLRKALQSEVLHLEKKIFLVDTGPRTPRICMKEEPTEVPINRATRFENKVEFLDLVASESLIKKRILERFFIDLVAGESLIKEQAATRFNDKVGSILFLNIITHKSTYQFAICNLCSR